MTRIWVIICKIISIRRETTMVLPRKKIYATTRQFLIFSICLLVIICLPLSRICLNCISMRQKNAFYWRTRICLSMTKTCLTRSRFPTRIRCLTSIRYLPWIICLPSSRRVQNCLPMKHHSSWWQLIILERVLGNKTLLLFMMT